MFFGGNIYCIMKITINQLRRIINEEIVRVVESKNQLSGNVMLPSTSDRFNPKSTMVGVPRPAELSTDFSKKPDSKHKVMQFSDADKMEALKKLLSLGEKRLASDLARSWNMELPA